MKTADLNPTEKIPTHADRMFTPVPSEHGGRPVVHFVAEVSDFGRNRVAAYAPGGTLRVLKIAFGDETVVFVQESRNEHMATFRATNGDAVVLFND